jgi:hypothetical protein
LPERGVRRQTDFWHGCNYPWSTDGTTIYYGLDFGANVWGSHLGVSTRRTAVERDFEQMAAMGFRVARWFVFADGRAGIVYDDRGMPAGLDPHFFADLDAACDIARGVEMQLSLVLLDHRWLFEGVRDTIADPTTGELFDVRLPHGRAHVLHSATGRAALLTRVFEPLVRRYAPGGRRADLSGQVFAFELMNEPDFVVEEWERDLSSHVSRPLRFEVLAQMVADLSALVHACSAALTMIGCARLHNLWAWDDPDLGLDLLQIHSYPDTRHPGRDLDPLVAPARSLGFSKPVLLGEFPADPGERHPPNASPVEQRIDEVMEAAVQGGYAGAWPWSFSGTDDYGPLPIGPLRQFAALHPELVNARAALPGG